MDDRYLGHLGTRAQRFLLRAPARESAELEDVDPPHTDAEGCTDHQPVRRQLPIYSKVLACDGIRRNFLRGMRLEVFLLCATRLPLDCAPTSLRLHRAVV